MKGDETVKIRDAELDIVCGYTSALPETELPQIAFAGRSNVGKSSLINVLMQRKRLARVGETPGKTRTVNYYRVDALFPDHSNSEESSGIPGERVEVFHLVDLPGYGYANVSLEEKAKWGRMVEKYLRMSRVLRAVFLLVDIRHAPNANDRQMYEWITAAGYRPVIIATKSDKIKRSQIQKQMKVLREGLSAPGGTVVIPFSAQSGSGREEISRKIDEVLGEKTQ